jgi:glutaminyl-peptide cyclotransferase
MQTRSKLLTFVALIILALTGCAPAVIPATATFVAPTITPTPLASPTAFRQSPTESTPALTTDSTAAPASTYENLRVEVLNRYPHDSAAFTEGLLWADGKVYESGGYYSISLREADLETGQVLRLQTEEGDHFGEGIALVGDEIILLTWQEQTAYRYDRATFERKGTFTYSGEGWGLCYDGTHLYQSDGTPAITMRDPQTFEPLSSIQVMLNGMTVEKINELECVGDSLYANVWYSTNILRIDKATGQVTALIDASGLLPPDQLPADANAVLNGIAYIPERDTFLITGKWWPTMFEVKFVPAQP